jgi:hypothetical protein
VGAAEELVGAGLLTIEGAVRFSAISQTVLYEFICTGEVAFVRRDDLARRYIPRQELVDLLASHLVSQRPLASAERADLVADGASSVGEAVDEGPFKRTTVSKLIKVGAVPVVKVPDCDPTIPRVALRRVQVAGLKPLRPRVPLTAEADAALAELAAHGVSPVEMAARIVEKQFRAMPKGWQRLVALAKKAEAEGRDGG